MSKDKNEGQADQAEYLEVSDVSAYGTNKRDCIREDFWFIVVTEGV